MARPTASKAWIEHEAASIERSAKESLPAWAFLGMTDRYDEAMAKAAALRRVAGVEDLSFRRTLLRELGYAA